MDCPISKSHRCFLYGKKLFKNKKYEIFKCEECDTYYMASVDFDDNKKFSFKDPKGKTVKVTNIHTAYIKNKLIIGDKIAKTQEEYKKMIENLPQIESHSLLIIQNIFQCINKKHSIENIDAAVYVLNKKFEPELVHINAGYCKQCKRYFILRSLYDDLLEKKGKPLCDTFDEKKYEYSHKFLSTMYLREQSILMEYGYSVSESEGVNDLARKKILASIVDFDILTKSEIINYLDFFINSHVYDDKFQNAIYKWEEDRRFISEYKTGEYRKIGVKYFYH